MKRVFAEEMLSYTDTLNTVMRNALSLEGDVTNEIGEVEGIWFNIYLRIPKHMLTRKNYLHQLALLITLKMCFQNLKMGLFS